MQIRDVIGHRVMEDRETAVSMKEVEVRAVTMAIYSAAGHTAGAKQAQKFTMMQRTGVEQAGKVPTIRELSKVFPAGSGATAMFSDEEIAAEIERQRVIAGG